MHRLLAAATLAAFQFDRGAPTPESFRFLASPGQAASIDVAGEGKKRKFEGIAYSGDVIEGHWYWDRVVFDLSTTKAPAKLPMLLGHDREKIVGFSERVEVGGEIKVGGMLSGVTDEGKHVAATSDEGFPWQMSVHIEPRSVEEVKAGATVVVNGRTFQGPINVFRNNVIREISFTPTGWDSQTSAVAMSRGGNESTDKESTMTEAEIKKLQEQAAQAAKFEADAKAEKAAREQAEAGAKVNADKVAAFEASQVAAAREKRDTQIKALFETVGTEFKDETAKPYREMSDEQFAAVDKQLRATAQKDNPELFQEQATKGASASSGTPEAIALRARELVFAAREKGQHLDVVDAVKQARGALA
jgi:hypothetical protein